MNEILSAISLLLAIISVIYGQWISEINKILSIKPDELPRNNTSDHKKSKKVFLQRAFPLACSSIVLLLVFTPAFFGELHMCYQSIKTFAIDKPFEHYDTIKAAFLVVYILIFLFDIYLISISYSVWLKIKALNPQKKNTKQK